MKNEAVSHILSSFDKDYKNVIDLSISDQEHNTLIFENLPEIIEGYKKELEGQTDCVLFFGKYSKESLLEAVLNSYKLLNEDGVFFLSLESENFNNWEVITLLRANGFKIIEASFDLVDDLKEHVFVCNKSKQVENKLVNIKIENPCSQSTEKCIVSKEQNLPDCCKEHLYELLKELSFLFDKIGIKYWLDGGTLLGAVRDGEMIAWDRNINIGILKNDLQKVKSVNKHLQVKGYYLTSYGNGYLVNYSRKNNLCVKMYSYLETPEWFKIGGSRYKSEYFLKLDKIKLNGIEYPCPKEVEKFLCEQYGENWKIPSNSSGVVTL